MRVYGTVVGPGNQPLGGADILVYEGATTLFGGESGPDGRFDFSNAGDYTGRLLRAVAAREAHQSAEQTFRPEANQAILNFALQPLRKSSEGYFHRSKKVWRRAAVVQGFLLIIGFFGHHDITELVLYGNPLLILLVTAWLFAKWPVYLWSGAFLMTSAHLLNLYLFLIAPNVSSGFGLRIRSDGYYWPIVWALNLVVLLLINRYRSRFNSWPIVGRLFRAERVLTFQWELDSTPPGVPPKL
jgi:hypothetical protein